MWCVRSENRLSKHRNLFSWSSLHFRKKRRLEDNIWFVMLLNVLYFNRQRGWHSGVTAHGVRDKQEYKLSSEREKQKWINWQAERHFKNKKGRPTNLYEVPLKTHQVLQESGDMQTHSETFSCLSFLLSWSLLGGVSAKEAPEKQHVWVNNRPIMSWLSADLGRKTAIIFAATELQASKHTWVEFDFLTKQIILLYM